ncbi:adenylyltransferase/sulfurtransferase MoeZ [Cryobacterium sp. MDB1-18-2]|uniref:ThiF family adenylyltransferase n=1 Tax=unclassified Cryobacterium TaxID=2649013 RepID=UPI00106D4995|nr:MULTISPECIES: ThiF family adenylyltransferase [unclassified Cryobacterium]TFC24949.1 adenylyltransferase/sulfurtransferase MoeZ [Cryobacterium sp. MDB1-18-2]TFC45715.1 adenylyltransferase/sulfurtransferase MoeZ [Cryobacterium sp. MDB1-18-1]
MALPPLVEPVARLTPTESVRTARQRRLPQLDELGQRRLANAKVLVLGAGGLGSPALLYLAAAGIGTIGIVDGDDVEPSNLQRQIVHGQADVGRPKVVSAAESIAAIAPATIVIQHAERLDHGNARALISGYDVVIDGTDNFPTRFLVNDVSAELGKPLVWASVLRFDAQLSVFWATPPEGSGVAGVQLRDLFPNPPAEGEVPSCAEAGVLGALCGQVGSLMATEAIKLVAGIGAPLIGRVLVIDALSGRFTEVPLVGGDAEGHARAASEAAAAAATDSGTANMQAPVPTWPTLSAAELVSRLVARANGADDFIVLDVREPGEHAESAVPGSLLLPLDQLRTPEGLASLPRDVPLVLHCAQGPRALSAAAALAADGFTDLTLLEGGIIAWDAAVADGGAPGFGQKWSTQWSGTWSPEWSVEARS